jgi:hypothetical protein
MAETGYAQGRLNPILYFENSAGEISMPPTTEEALRFKKQMEAKGWELREAGTLSEVDKLQTRLQELEIRRVAPNLEHHQKVREAVRKQVSSNLYARLATGIGDYEKEFIRCYLQLREEKRDRYRDIWTQRQMYLHVREMDENTLGTDRILEGS